ncbi:hypothetical protein ONZ45_g19548 [Pleurotus djamor]|nr:hypothetical protein ONZ45_g19548 [Pleurotus djamor]
MNSLPNELLLHIFRQLPLKTLISARGVCVKWRDMLLVADIHPTRRALYEIHLQILEESWFRKSRLAVQRNLKEFDRKAYVDSLLLQHNYLPDDYKMWVLEWPALATFGGFWPGLPSAEHAGARWGVVNLLDSSKPTVYTLSYIAPAAEASDLWEEGEEIEDWFPAIPITINVGDDVVWLVLDETHYRGEVVQTYSDPDTFQASQIDDEVVVWSSWVEYLRDKVDDLEYTQRESIPSFHLAERIDFAPWRIVPTTHIG